MAGKKKNGVEGGDELRERLDVILRNVDDAVQQAIDDAADDLLDRAIALSPQDEGDHIESGKVLDAGTFLRLIIFDMPYSVWLHEGEYNLGTGSRLKPPTEDGEIGPGYLSRPFNKHEDRYIDEIREAIGEAIRLSVR